MKNNLKHISSTHHDVYYCENYYFKTAHSKTPYPEKILFEHKIIQRVYGDSELFTGKDGRVWLMIPDRGQTCSVNELPATFKEACQVMHSIKIGQLGFEAPNITDNAINNFLLKTQKYKPYITRKNLVALEHHQKNLMPSIEQWTEPQKNELILCHTDINGRNAATKENKTKLIDLEEAAWGIPEIDLASALHASALLDKGNQTDELTTLLPNLNFTRLAAWLSMNIILSMAWAMCYHPQDTKSRIELANNWNLHGLKGLKMVQTKAQYG